MKKHKNLVSGLLDEINRVRELKTEYERLPNGVGFFGSTTMKVFIQQAEESLASGDVGQMLICYKNLKDCTG